MSSDENTRLYRRYVEEVLNNANLAVIDELLAPAFVRHTANHPTDIQGREAFKHYVGLFRAAFPDFVAPAEDLFAAGDRVAYRWTFRGTHTGELLGIGATGKQVSVPGIIIARVVAGQIVEEWESYDTLGFMQQLGVLPAPSTV
jgi:steroid delta-isomerase-like uncharacterized protein